MHKYKLAGNCKQIQRDFCHPGAGLTPFLQYKMSKLLYICALKIDFQLLVTLILRTSIKIWFWTHVLKYEVPVSQTAAFDIS